MRAITDFPTVIADIININFVGVFSFEKALALRPSLLLWIFLQI